LMMEEGVTFRTNANVGVDVSVAELKVDFDAIVLAGGSTRPRDLPATGRELKGIHFAMDYLTMQNRVNEGEPIRSDEFITAKGKHVIIIGGGDTGADCLGTAHRQGAASVHQLELLAQPPDSRAPGNPWPLWPNIFRVSTAHEEGGERMYSIATQRFSGNDMGQVTTLHAHRVDMVNESGRVQFKPVPNSEFEHKADLVLLAMGFLGAETNGMLDKLGVKMTERGTVWRDERWMTSVPGVFTAGDKQGAQSLIGLGSAGGPSSARGGGVYVRGR